MSSASKSTIETTYQMKSQLDHVLHLPDTYIGSVEKDRVPMWTFDPAAERMAHREVEIVPGLFKCFDEAAVNARDHYIRMGLKVEAARTAEEKAAIKPVTKIDFEVDRDTGVISITNDGNGIDVVEHAEHGIWVPEMIFGHMRSSTQYSGRKKIVGGKNGFGIKLVFIFAKWGTVETVDHTRGLKYVQRFEDNLRKRCKPTITKLRSKAPKPYTRVTWLPDYERFGLPGGLTDDMYNIFTRRAYDIAAVTTKNVKVSFNKKLLPVKTFEQYVNMYIGSKTDTKRIYEQSGDRWEYAVCLTPQDEFAQVSFVNGIHTDKGGRHVSHVADQVVRKIAKMIEDKKGIKVKPATIKEQLMVFVNCVVEDPAFDSQTKSSLTTPVEKFGSRCAISDKFVDKVAKLGVLQTAVSLNEVKTRKEGKKTDGKKTRMVKGVPKLTDASRAGTARSAECTLILCEGDSAKAGIVSGLSRDDRETIGVFPLKGKLMNIRDATAAKVNANAELADLKKILGLESGKRYKDASGLRYGSICIMCDQDVDGSHIKGLIINALDSQWPELLHVKGFLSFMNTPILKATRGKTVLSFYNDAVYQRWKEENDTRGWKVKYYKGLGTSTSKEFKEYFANKRTVDFAHSGCVCSETIDMVFNKKRSDDRKEWLGDYDKDCVLDTDDTEVSYGQFIDEELIHFSKYDCERSIPNVMDGLKTSLRKILFAAFKRNLTKEIKVAQFGGYVSEHSGYHHGEASLMGAIIGMAQDYVGSNNINLLLPNGQFGTRMTGGKDHASERYIFTALNPITRAIFNAHDDAVLNYLSDDGQPIEPEFYVPILPMVLVNGTTGIGTGFSTDVMCYNPLQLIDYMVWHLGAKAGVGAGDGSGSGAGRPALEPYYEGFRGQVLRADDHKYVFAGNYEVVNAKKGVIRVTELPVGMWTETYKVFLEKLMDDGDAKGKSKSSKSGLVKEYTEMNTDTTVEFEITLRPGVLEKLEATAYLPDLGLNGVYKELKLTTSKTSTNMHLFDPHQRLRKYADVHEIIDEFAAVRLEHYTMRKAHQLKQLDRERVLLSNKARFIQEQCDDVIDLRRKKAAAVVALLTERGYDAIDGDDTFKYLRSMPIDSVVEENIAKLLAQRDEKVREYEALLGRTEQQLWIAELEALREEYVVYRAAREAKSRSAAKEGGDGKKAKKAKRSKAKK
jgi:DNA topoisomerase-2